MNDVCRDYKAYIKSLIISIKNQLQSNIEKSWGCITLSYFKTSNLKLWCISESLASGKRRILARVHDRRSKAPVLGGEVKVLPVSTVPIIGIVLVYSCPSTVCHYW